ncbi:MAG: MarR family transcriptional regulator [Pseudomonadota bacterium]|nr:MarR family transcriptional regulator [Pseudomonadota bacterium]MEE3100631.1 MarR family transcriptional regulator [Pseudomonadota bacterium]
MMARDDQTAPAATTSGGALSATAIGAEPGPMSIPDLPGHLLRRCHQIVVALFLDECAVHDLTPLQFAVLGVLRQFGPLDQVSLGGLAALDRTTVAVVLRNLEERGLVTRNQSRRDRRAKIVTITERGAEVAIAAEPAAMRAQERALAPLDDAESVEFVRLLRKLAEGNNDFSRAPQKRR